MPTSVDTGRHTQTIGDTTTLRGDHDHALGGTAAVEHHGLGALQERDLLNLRGQHVVGITGYTVNQYEYGIGHARFREAPHGRSIESSHIALHVIKAIGIIVLVHQVSVVQAGDTTQDIFLGHLAKGHIDLG